MYLGNRFNAAGQTDPSITYSPDFVMPGKSPELVLSIAKTALVFIEEEEGQVAILDSNDHENYESDLHFPQAGSEVIYRLLEAGYPRIFSPTRSLFEFWRQNQKAPEELVQTEYGFKVESWLNRQVEISTEYLFTFFNAMKRTYEDTPEANHVELRQPGSSVASPRIPYDEFLWRVDVPGYHPRSQQYVELWLPRLAMDLHAAKWHQRLEDKKTEEFEKEIAAAKYEIMGIIEEDLDRAERARMANEFDAIINSSLSGMNDAGTVKV